MSELTDRGRELLERLHVVVSDEPQSLTQQRLGLELCMFAERDDQARDLRRCPEAGTFSDVRRYRHRRLAHVERETEVLVPRELVGQGINKLSEVHGFLPGQEIAVARDFGHAAEHASPVPLEIRRHSSESTSDCE